MSQSPQTLMCNHCFNIFKSSDTLHYSSLCAPNMHIWCNKCVNYFKNCGSIICKLCKKKRPLNISKLPFSPWNPMPFIYIFGATPGMIQEAATKGHEFWEKQQRLQKKRYRSIAAKQQEKLKSERNKYQSDSLKCENEINNQTKKTKQYQLAAIKYKKGYQKALQNAKKFQSDLNEKTRQFNNLNSKYTEILKKKSRRKSHSNSSLTSSINSLGSFPSHLSPTHSRNSHNSQQSQHSSLRCRNSPSQNRTKRRNTNNNNNLTQHTSHTIAETVISNNGNNDLYDRHQRQPNPMAMTRYHPYSQSQQPQTQIIKQKQRRHSLSHQTHAHSQPNQNQLPLVNIPRKKAPKRNPRRGSEFGMDSLGMGGGGNMNTNFNDNMSVGSTSPMSFMSGVSGAMTTSHHTVYGGGTSLPMIRENSSLEGSSGFGGISGGQRRGSRSRTQSNTNLYIHDDDLTF